MASNPSISADGRYVAFAYTNPPVTEIFLRDRQTNTTERISVSTGGVAADGQNQSPAISYDGCCVAFVSTSTNLVAGDIGQSDVFVRDRVAGTTDLVHVSSAGVQGNGFGSSGRPSISADGKLVVFGSTSSDLVAGDLNGHVSDIFLHDRTDGTTRMSSVNTAGVQGNAGSSAPSIDEGNNVVFQSVATNLVPDDTNTEADIFIRGPATYTISVSASPPAGGEVSGDGTLPGGFNETVVASANPGFSFVNWTENGLQVSTEALYTFFLIADRTLVANLSHPNFRTIQVSASPEEGGTVDGEGSFAVGSSRNVTAVANPGYAFVKWMEGTSQVSTSANYTFSLVNNRNLVAHFVRMHTIAVSASPPAGGTVGGAGTFAKGTSRTVTATPKPGFVFVKWTQGGTQVSTSRNYTFTLNANRTLVAHFRAQNYTVGVAASPAAGGTVSGGGSFPANTSRTVRATPKPGYEFVVWKQGTAQVAVTSSYTFLLTANRSLTAIFRLSAPKNDLLVDRGAQGLYLFKNNTTWQRIHARSPTVMAAADINGNGKDDALFALTTPAASVGTWQRLDSGALTKVNPRAAVGLAVGDVDNNGRDDLVGIFTGQTGTFIRLNGAAAWTKIHNLTALAVATGDLNGNKKSDILIALTNGLWVRYDNAGAWSQIDTVRPLLLATGDYDNNVKAEVAVGRGAAGIWARTNNAGSWLRLRTGNASLLSGADPDGNKRTDALAAFANGLWQRNPATGVWVRIHTLRPTAIAAVDLDNNGKQEVAAILPGQGLRARMNNTTTWRILLASPQPQGVVAGGFD